MATTIIRIEGDKRYTQMLKAIAAQRGCTVAQLVRDAVDSTHGDSLRQQAVLFSAMTVRYVTQSCDDDSATQAEVRE